MFAKLTIDLDSQLTETTKDYRLRLKKLSKVLVEKEIIDPDTLQPRMATGHMSTNFMAKLDINKYECIVRRVIMVQCIEPIDESEE